MQNKESSDVYPRAHGCDPTMSTKRQQRADLGTAPRPGVGKYITYTGGCKIRFPLPKSLAIPNHTLPTPPHLTLQLQHAVQQSLCRRWAPRHVNVDGNDAVTAPHDRVRIMVVSTSVRARTHGNHPTRFRHLVIDFPQSRSHLVCQGSRHDHDVRLSRAGTEYNPEPVLIIPSRSHMHHLHSATRQTKRHRPHRTLPTPIRNLVQRRQNVLGLVLWFADAQLRRTPFGDGRDGFVRVCREQRCIV